MKKVKKKKEKKTNKDPFKKLYLDEYTIYT